MSGARARREPPEGYSDLQHAIAAYNALMKEIVPESQYYQGKREYPDKVAYLGSIVERAAARRREAEREAEREGGG